MKNQSEVVSQCCIPVTLEDGEAVILHLLNDAGEQVDRDEATVAAARLLTGKHAGFWVFFAIAPEDFEHVKVH